MGIEPGSKEQFTVLCGDDRKITHFGKLEMLVRKFEHNPRERVMQYG